MNTLQVIQKELTRQWENSGTHGLGYYGGNENPEETVIDGTVDLVALAKAIDDNNIQFSFPTLVDSIEQCLLENYEKSGFDDFETFVDWVRKDRSHSLHNKAVTFWNFKTFNLQDSI